MEWITCLPVSFGPYNSYPASNGNAPLQFLLDLWDQQLHSHGPSSSPQKLFRVFVLTIIEKYVITHEEIMGCLDDSVGIESCHAACIFICH